MIERDLLKDKLAREADDFVGTASYIATCIEDENYDEVIGELECLEGTISTMLGFLRNLQDLEINGE